MSFTNLTYGFFDSTSPTSNDRTYTANEFGEIFDGVIKDGVYSTIGDCFLVTQCVDASGNPTMDVRIGTGRAWFNGTWTKNTQVGTLHVNDADSQYPRIDSVVLYVDKGSSKSNGFKIIEGTANLNPVHPELAYDDTTLYYEHRIADIYVNKNATAIMSADINNTVKEYASGIFDITDLLNVSRDRFNNKVEEWDSKAEDSVEEHDTDFETWFNSIQPQFEEEDYIKILNAVNITNKLWTVTFLENAWEESEGKYVQTISVLDMQENYNPILCSAISELPSPTFEDAQDYNRNLVTLSSGYGTTANNSITWTCFRKPDADITVFLKGGVAQVEVI